MQLTISDQ